MVPPTREVIRRGAELAPKRAERHVKDAAECRIECRDNQIEAFIQRVQHPIISTTSMLTFGYKF